MPMLDMPLEQLKTYQGTNPRPKDFDAYWDRALAEMNAVDPQVELRPAKFQPPFATAYNMFFTGMGGARVHAKVLKPKKAAKSHGAVLQFHGYGGYSGDWTPKLGYAAAGLTYAGLDCRGQWGLSSDAGPVHVGNTHIGHFVRGMDEADPDKLFFRKMYLDTAQLAKIVMEMDDVDPDRVGCFGGSLGGGLTLACAGLTPRMKLVSPVFPFLTDFQRGYQMDLCKDAYAELRDYLRNRDTMCERREEIFTKLGYIDTHHLAARIKGEVLMAVTLMDSICPPSTQFAAYNRITSKKNMVLFQDFGHEWLPGFDDTTFEFMMGL